MRPFIERQVANMHQPINVENPDAVALHYLSDDGHSTANTLGTSWALTYHTKSDTSNIPSHEATLTQSEEDVNKKATQFFSVNCVPQCLDAMDGTHIEIKELNSSDYINHKSWDSLNIQACCDYQCCFMDAVVKWLRCVHEGSKKTSLAWIKDETYNCQTFRQLCSCHHQWLIQASR